LGALHRFHFKDIDEAIKWHQMAAEQGHVKSHLSLGAMYQYAKKDTGTAIGWYEKAYVYGDLVACRELGKIYRFGKGVPKDLEKSEHWYTKCAEAGDHTSKRNLEVAQEQRLLVVERKQKAFDRLGTIGIAWLPIDPSFLKEKTSNTSQRESEDAEVRGYLYAPIAFVSWPAWLLTAVVGESGVAAKKSAEHTHMQNTVRKVFDESDIQNFFIGTLLEAANEQLENPVAVLDKHEETQSYSDEISADTAV